MKKLLGILIILLFVVTFALVISNKRKFYLDEQYYKSSSLIDIKANELIELENNKKSFIIFVYDPLCSTSYDLNDNVNEFINIYNISFYKILFSNIENTRIQNKVKYCPSIVIYKNGRVVSYLDASSNKDIKYYESTKTLKEWLNKYIHIEYNK